MNTETTSIIDLPLEMLNYLCTYLTWMDVVMVELAIPNLRVQQCGIHYDFKLAKLRTLIKHFRKLKRKQCKYDERFQFVKFMNLNNPKPYLQPHIIKAIRVIRKLNQHLYLIKKVEGELQVKFLQDEDIDIFCSYCQSKFNDVDALETHSENVFPKCYRISIEDLAQFIM